MTRPELSIVIPSWNGLDLLREHLPGVLRARGEVASAEVVVVDDGSEDGTARALPREAPEVKLVRRARRGGFAVAANAGVAEAAGRLVLLLNNDVEVREGAVGRLAEAARDGDVFAAVPEIVRADSRVDESWTVLRFRRGVVSAGVGEPGREAPAYACGGAMAFRRETFEALGGFDPLLSPFYWEDVDLSYRARKRGLAIARVAGASVLHDHGRTIAARFERGAIETLYERNRLIFTWKNLTDPGLLAAHLAALPAKLIWDLVAHPAFVRGFGQAIGLLGGIRTGRRAERGHAARRDRDLLGRTGPIPCGIAMLR